MKFYIATAIKGEAVRSYVSNSKAVLLNWLAGFSDDWEKHTPGTWHPKLKRDRRMSARKKRLGRGKPWMSGSG